MAKTKCYFYLLACVAFSSILLCVRAQENPVVQTKLGKLVGTMMKSRLGKDIYAFRSIRYAKAPVGERRFLPPEPVDAWTGTYDSTQEGPACCVVPSGKSLRRLFGFERLHYRGVCHQDDLFYLFYRQSFPMIKTTDKENIILERFTTIWTHFARTAKPIPDNSSLFNNVAWETLKVKPFNYLEIGNTVEMKENFFPERIQFWEKIFPLQ